MKTLQSATLSFVIILTFCTFTSASDIYHPVAHWTFDEPNGTTVYDSAGSSNGTLMNGATRTAGKFGNALQFDGINDYVEISGANDTAIEFNKSSKFTISLWTKLSPQTQGGYFIDKMRAHSQSGVFGYEVGYNATKKFAGFVVEASKVAYTEIDTNSNVLTADRWGFVTAVYDNNQMAIYLDGQLQSTGVFTYNSGTTFPDKNMVIGARSADSIIANYFNGSIDDVRIYNYALDANEIAELYAGELPELEGIGIVGPNSVPEELTTQYQIIGHYDNGSSKDVTADANLSVEPGEFAQIDSNGLLTTFSLYRPRQLCTISADYQGSSMKMPVAIYAICDGNECTMPQLLKRNIADVIEIKQGIMEDLNYAMKIERASIQMLPKIANGRQITIWQRAQLLKANIKILAALADELWAKKEVDKSIDSLEIALELLRSEKPGKGPK
jgi:hypothetical protein